MLLDAIAKVSKVVAIALPMVTVVESRLACLLAKVGIRGGGVPAAALTASSQFSLKSFGQYPNSYNLIVSHSESPSSHSHTCARASRSLREPASRPLGARAVPAPPLIPARWCRAAWPAPPEHQPRAAPARSPGGYVFCKLCERVSRLVSGFGLIWPNLCPGGGRVQGFGGSVDFRAQKCSFGADCSRLG
jgi:hypothetical protein